MKVSVVMVESVGDVSKSVVVFTSNSESCCEQNIKFLQRELTGIRSNFYKVAELLETIMPLCY